jgi:hypothetical protein
MSAPACDAEPRGAGLRESIAERIFDSAVVSFAKMDWGSRLMQLFRGAVMQRRGK